MSIKLLRENLNKYYNDAGIAVSPLFCCPNREHCEQAENGQELSKGSEAHIGSKYGNPYKLVIASMDRGEGSECVWDRSNSIESLKVEDLNPHMWGTLLTVELLLKKDWTGVESFKYFAMTNTAKCCYKRKGMTSVKPELYKNCAPFASEEIELLDPDLVVTQGKKAKLFIENRSESIPKETFYKLLGSRTNNIVKLENKLKFISINGNKKLLVFGPHPSDPRGQTWFYFYYQLLPLIRDFVWKYYEL